MNKPFVSISTKLFAVFVIMITLFEIGLWLISANTLQFLLIYGKEVDMKEIIGRYQADTQNLQVGDLSNRDELLALISYEWDGNLSVVDIEKDLYRSTIPPMRDERAPRNNFERSKMLKNLANEFKDLKVGSVDSITIKDRNGKDNMVIVIGRANDSQYLFSEKQLSTLNDSSELVSKFIVISGLVLIFIGSIVVYFLSKRLTKSIIEIENQAVKIAAMDFKSHNDISQSDEIGSLGRAVNQIAYELEASMSALSEANSQLKGEIEQERRMEQTRRQFVSNVSHELKTPISMIMGYADGLKHGIVKNEEQRSRYYDVIISESEKMSQLIGDLLDMSAYQAGKMPIQNRTFELSQMLTESLLSYEEQAALRELTLVTEIEDNLVVNGDPVRLNQVFVNLISNAFKHVSERGSVVVKAYSAENQVCLEVYNEGDPISEEESEAIWMSFYRGSNSREKQIEGFGIGLALVKEIIEKHEGQVYFKNEPSGVKFFASIPKG